MKYFMEGLRSLFRHPFIGSSNKR